MEQKSDFVPKISLLSISWSEDGEMSQRWYAPSFRWPEFGLWLRSASFSWPDFSFSNFSIEWNSPNIRWFNFSILDDLLWTFIALLESLVLLTMLCCFFLCCGFTLWFSQLPIQYVVYIYKFSSSSISKSSQLVTYPL